MCLSKSSAHQCSTVRVMPPLLVRVKVPRGRERDQTVTHRSRRRRMQLLSGAVSLSSAHEHLNSGGGGGGGSGRSHSRWRRSEWRHIHNDSVLLRLHYIIYGEGGEELVDTRHRIRGRDRQLIIHAVGDGDGERENQTCLFYRHMLLFHW
jgi:hypothetical protein